MPSKKLRTLFLISLFLIYAHGAEEVLGGFQENDSFMVFFAQLFNTTATNFYWISHLVWWVTLLALFWIFKNSRTGLLLMTIFSAVFIIEVHHIIKAIIARQYYPGAITTLFYPILGFFYWRQLISDWSRSK